jgi:hypothetical protein
MFDDMSVSCFHRRLSAGKALINSEINNQIWKHYLSAHPSKEDIIQFLVVLEELCQFHLDESKLLAVGYDVFRALRKDCRTHPKLKEDFLTPQMFMKMSGTNGKVSIPILTSIITHSLSQEALFSSLACYSVGDASSEHIMSIDALEDWLFKLSYKLVQVNRMTEQFLPLWVFTAAHTIGFFHGKQKSSRVHIPVPGTHRTVSSSVTIKIRDFVGSETMKFLLQLSRPFVEDMDANPFSRLRAVRYYDSFTVFESGRMQADAIAYPVTELCPIFAGGYMTPIFMERLSTVYGCFDYRRFLSFAIAWENRRTATGVRYFWPTVDIEGKGYMTRVHLEYFVKGMVTLLACLPAACGPQGPNAVTILVDEILDLFLSNTRFSAENSHNPEFKLTLSDALEMPQAFGTMIGLIGNSQSFIEYECREDTAHKQFVAKQVKEARINRQQQNHQSRSGQLTALQEIIDECWFINSNPGVECKFDSFPSFLDYHETQYGGESMEPWLNRYYQWEQQEAERHQMMLLESQLVLSEGDSLSMIAPREDDMSADGIQFRE